MLKRSLMGAFVLGCLLVIAVSVWAQRGPGRGVQRGDGVCGCLAMLDSIPKQVLDASEAEGLVYLREEEKLTHDLYAKFADKWGVRIFSNISGAEVRHLEAIKALLARYALQDPSMQNTAGVFNNPEIQALYSELLIRGETSFKEALRVGATLEDLSLYELAKASEATDNDDLKLVYRNLLEASRNHLRAFIRQLEAAGETYAAQYISPEELSGILVAQTQPGAGSGSAGSWKRGTGRSSSGICPFARP